jgi:hypothetical protein
MKQLLPLLFLFCACRTYTPVEKAFIDQQNALLRKCPSNCHCTLLPAYTLITKPRVKTRRDLFAAKRTQANLKLDDSIRYDINGILALLEKVAIRKPGGKKYDGLRVYFGASPDSPTKLALIFVPTWWNPKWTRWDRHVDDTGQYTLVTGPTITTIPRSVAADWIARAGSSILDSFQRCGEKAMGRKYHETRSLWYARFVLRSNHLHNGLIDILKCRACCDSAKYVDAWFGAFPMDAWNRGRKYQLTLIFSLDGQNKFYVSLHGSDTNATDGSDTGNPCPPPSNCSTIGASISQ